MVSSKWIKLAISLTQKANVDWLSGRSTGVLSGGAATDLNINTVDLKPQVTAKIVGSQPGFPQNLSDDIHLTLPIRLPTTTRPQLRYSIAWVTPTGTKLFRKNPQPLKLLYYTTTHSLKNNSQILRPQPVRLGRLYHGGWRSRHYRHKQQP